jgi:hypothetical protein
MEILNLNSESSANDDGSYVTASALLLLDPTIGDSTPSKVVAFIQ